MAKASSIARLHNSEAQPEPVKCGNLQHSQPDVSAPAPAPRERVHRTRGGFKIGAGRDEQGYSLDPVEILSIVHEANALDRAGDFRAMAEREKLLRIAQSLRTPRPAQRGGPPSPFAITA